MTESALLPPEEWQRVFNIRIVDPDGRRNHKVSWDKKLLAREFIGLASESTLEPYKWKES